VTPQRRHFRNRTAAMVSRASWTSGPLALPSAEAQAVRGAPKARAAQGASPEAKAGRWGRAAAADPMAVAEAAAACSEVAEAEPPQFAKILILATTPYRPRVVGAAAPTWCHKAGQIRSWTYRAIRPSPSATRPVV
jgi:hypothetical protein